MSGPLDRFHSRPALVCVTVAHAAAAWAIAQFGYRAPTLLPQPIEVVLLPDVAPQPLPQADVPLRSEPATSAQPLKPLRVQAQSLQSPSVAHAPSQEASQPEHAPIEPATPADPAVTELRHEQAFPVRADPVPEPVTRSAVDAGAPSERPVANPFEAPDALRADAPVMAPREPSTSTQAQQGVMTSESSLRTGPPVAARESSDAPDAAAELPAYSAAYLRNPKPDYPALSKRLGEQGVVTLRVYVDTAGNPQAVQLKASSGFGRLDHAAQDAVKRWRFTPAKRGDDAIAAWVLVPIRFSLRG